MSRQLYKPASFIVSARKKGSNENTSPIRIGFWKAAAIIVAGVAVAASGQGLNHFIDLFTSHTKEAKARQALANPNNLVACFSDGIDSPEKRALARLLGDIGINTTRPDQLAKLQINGDAFQTLVYLATQYQDAIGDRIANRSNLDRAWDIAVRKTLQNPEYARHVNGVVDLLNQAAQGPRPTLHSKGRATGVFASPHYVTAHLTAG